MANEIIHESPHGDDIEFTFYWDLFVGDVAARDNFKMGHLQQLRILCNLFKEFDKLTKVISERGYSYSTDSRNGMQEKPTIEVTIRDKVMLEIRMYSKMLGLILEKDSIKNEKESVDDWD